MTHSVSSPLGVLSITISGKGYVRSIGLSLPEHEADEDSERQCAKNQCMPVGYTIDTSLEDWKQSIDFNWECNQQPLARGKSPQSNSTLENTITQLTHYFREPRWCFELPLAPRGTPFQQRVWQALRSIPSGKIISYGMLAAQLGTGARAVGNACRENPIPIIIPCHRVVGVRDCGGFMGARSGKPLAIKQWLLRHESGQEPTPSNFQSEVSPFSARH
ncbi:MAG: O-6-methylguanine DNA methyltransferase [Candidatus Kentron sp. G]|nr:MAG: O-6-methylguanine DNA methyltransferase [Candidatus Kentron sp. G]VFN02739.1 MAG: O-6-methylguanine DNA methyltransferase [Candidatus Kentron sp. G]VFN02909.1 MAG: O-6-methylguanine DNA methyltransferase [Candidatus Kentron sp. G]